MCLDLAEPIAELLVLGVRLELAQSLQVGQPADPQRIGDQLRQRRVGQPDEPARCDAVGHVGELAREELVEVGQHLVAQQLRVQLGHAVHLGPGDRGQVRHPDGPLRVLGDDRHPADPELVTVEPLGDLLQELLVDPVDDLQVPRQQPTEQIDRPDLEGLRQQGVAGVREALLGDGPGLVPLHLLLVDQHPHQLRYADHGVGVVELEDDPLRQVAQIEVLGQHEVEEVVNGRGDEEVLLLQPQFLALRRGVLGVEHLGDVLREGLRADGLLVVTGVEDPQVERVGGDRPPQPQRVHPAVLVARDHVVVRDGLDLPARHPAGAFDPIGIGVLLGVTAEGDDLRGLGVRELPGRAEGQPGVGLLDLAAVDEGLPEDAVLVADAVTDAGHAHGGQRVDEAGGQPTETAVAQTRLDLLGPQGGQVDTALTETLLDDLGQPGGQQRVAELAAEQVLGGQVRHALRLGLGLASQRLQPASHQVVADRTGQRQVLVVDRAGRQGHALAVVELAEELTNEAVDRARGRADRGQGQRVRGLRLHRCGGRSRRGGRTGLGEAVDGEVVCRRGGVLGHGGNRSGVTLHTCAAQHPA